MQANKNFFFSHINDKLFLQCQYGQQPWCNQLQALVKIVLNTLDMQHHQCKRIPATVVMAAPPSRSRGKNLKISKKKYNVVHTG